MKPEPNDAMEPTPGLVVNAVTKTQIANAQGILDAAKVIESFVDGTCGPYDWDDFLNDPKKDARLQEIREECRRVEIDHPARTNHDWCNDEGTQSLLAIAARLRREATGWESAGKAEPKGWITMKHLLVASAVLVGLIVISIHFVASEAASEENFDKIKDGMTQAEVRELLGEPEGGWDGSAERTKFRYGGFRQLKWCTMEVFFGADGKVHGKFHDH